MGKFSILIRSGWVWGGVLMLGKAHTHIRRRDEMYLIYSEFPLLTPRLRSWWGVMGCTDSEFPLHPPVEILGAKDLLMGWMYFSYSELPPLPQVEILGAKESLMGWRTWWDVLTVNSLPFPRWRSWAPKTCWWGGEPDGMYLQWILSPSPGGDPGSQRLADGLWCTYTEFPPLPQVEILGAKDLLMGCDGMYLQWIPSPSPGGDPGCQRLVDGVWWDVLTVNSLPFPRWRSWVPKTGWWGVMGCTYSELPPLPQVEILGAKDWLMGCDGMYLQWVLSPSPGGDPGCQRLADGVQDHRAEQTEAGPSADAAVAAGWPPCAQDGQQLHWALSHDQVHCPPASHVRQVEGLGRSALVRETTLLSGEKDKPPFWLGGVGCVGVVLGEGVGECVQTKILHFLSLYVFVLFDFSCL